MLFKAHNWLFKHRCCCIDNRGLNFDKVKESNKMEKELLEKLSALLGCEAEEVSLEKLDGLSMVEASKLEALEAFKNESEDLSTKVSELEKGIEELTKSKGELETSFDSERVELSSKIEALEAEKVELSAKAELIDGILTSKVEYAVEMYSKAVEGKVNEAIVNEIKATKSIELLDAKIELYGGKAHQNYSATCTECGSKDITHRSSVEADSEGNQEPILNGSMAENVLFNRKF